MDKHAALRQYLGYESFRPGQEALIDAILNGRDALDIMPTGADLEFGENLIACYNDSEELILCQE